MKLKYLFGLLLSALFFVGCSDEDNTLGSLGNIVLDKTYVTIPENGGSVTVNVSATDAWTLSELPEWLTANMTFGSAGDSQLTFSADAVSGSREVELKITVGDYTQFLVVRQGTAAEATLATCAEVIAGNDGKTYRVKGTCATISNTTYGNWYLQDETGEIYIYGTLDASGAEKNFESLGIEAGDIVEVEGPKTTYNGTVELVNVTVISITKSLVKVITPDTIMPAKGGELELKVAYKGSGAYPEIASDCLNWIHYASTEYIASEGADTAIVKFNIAENTGIQRSGAITFKSNTSSTGSSVTYTVSQEGVGGTVEKPYTVAEAIAVATSGTGEVYVKGTICKISSISTSYGNATYYISDDGTDSDGKSLQIFRGYYLNKDKFTSEDQLAVGDEVVVVGKLKMYNGTPEMDSGNYIYSHTGLSTVAQVLAGTDGETYRIKGIVKNIKSTTYGNYYIEDTTGEIYIYGTLDADGNSKNFASLGIEEGDIIEVKGPRSTYKEVPQLKNVTVVSITKK